MVRVHSPISIGRVIGVERMKIADKVYFEPTTKISIITDKYGNLTNMFPGRIEVK